MEKSNKGAGRKSRETKVVLRLGEKSRLQGYLGPLPPSSGPNLLLPQPGCCGCPAGDIVWTLNHLPVRRGDLFSNTKGNLSPFRTEEFVLI